MKQLTARQGRFVEEYLVDMNGTEAAIRAGYSPKGKAPGVQAVRLLADARIQTAIARARDRVTKRVELTQEAVVEEVRRLALGDPTAVLDDRGVVKPPSQWPPEVRAMVSGLEVTTRPDGSIHYKVRFWDKGNALNMAARILALFQDKVDTTVTGKLEVTWDIPGSE